MEVRRVGMLGESSVISDKSESRFPGKHVRRLDIWDEVRDQTVVVCLMNMFGFVQDRTRGTLGKARACSIPPPPHNSNNHNNSKLFIWTFICNTTVTLLEHQTILICRDHH